VRPRGETDLCNLITKEIQISVLAISIRIVLKNRFYADTSCLTKGFKKEKGRSFHLKRSHFINLIAGTAKVNSIFPSMQVQLLYLVSLHVFVAIYLACEKCYT
jgi:hypothetical protein